jgi:hypothetical protein
MSHLLVLRGFTDRLWLRNILHFGKDACFETAHLCCKIRARKFCGADEIVLS